MSQTPLPNEADRIALTNMFKAIAEYGHKVRQRRQAQSEKAGQIESEEPNQDSQDELPATDERNELSEFGSS